MPESPIGLVQTQIHYGRFSRSGWSLRIPFSNSNKFPGDVDCAFHTPVLRGMSSREYSLNQCNIG